MLASRHVFIYRVLLSPNEATKSNQIKSNQIKSNQIKSSVGVVQQLPFDTRETTSRNPNTKGVFSLTKSTPVNSNSIVYM